MRRVQAMAPPLALGPTARRVALIVLVVLAIVVLMALVGDLDVLQGALERKEKIGKGQKGVGGIEDAINSLQKPATVTVGSLSGLGVLAGGGMMGLGMPQGIKLLGVSGGSMAAITIANGIVA